MEKTTLYCDICEKETWYNYIYITILIGDKRKWKKDGDWNYQTEESHLVCEDCIGSGVERCDGSHNFLSIKDKGINLLRKLKFIN